MSTTTPSPRRRFPTWAAALLGALAGAALVATASVASLSGGPLGHFGRHGGSHGFDEDRVRFGIEWMLRGADATDEQVEAITRIATSAHDDLRGLHDDRDTLREAWHQALVAEEVDPATVESLRGDLVQRMDAASQRLAEAVVEASAILTPEQRAALAERHEERRGRRHGFRGHAH